jgi:hypothetical protein
MHDLFSTDDGLKVDRSQAALLQAQEALEKELSAQEQVGRREQRVQQRDQQRRAQLACVAQPEQYDAGLGGVDGAQLPLARSLATAHCRSHCVKRVGD